MSESSPDIEAVLREVQALTDEEQEALAWRILGGLEQRLGKDEDYYVAWRDEIRRRVESVERSGGANLLPEEEVMAELFARLDNAKSLRLHS